MEIDQLQVQPSRTRLSKSEVRLGNKIREVYAISYIISHLPGGYLLPNVRSISCSNRRIAIFIRVKSEAAIVILKGKCLCVIVNQLARGSGTLSSRRAVLDVGEVLSRGSSLPIAVSQQS